MTSNQISLGTRTIEEVHESAIMLCIAVKQRDRESNPAHGIYFALTNESWPSHVPEVTNAIDLCAVLSEAMGQPKLSEEDKRNLNLKALHLFQRYESGSSPIHMFHYFQWANRAAYLLGAASLVFSGFSWLVVGLMVTTWLCFGAARTAAQISKQEERPVWECPVIICMHISALLALTVASLLHLIL